MSDESLLELERAAKLGDLAARARLIAAEARVGRCSAAIAAIDGLLHNAIDEENVLGAEHYWYVADRRHVALAALHGAWISHGETQYAWAYDYMFQHAVKALAVLPPGEERVITLGVKLEQPRAHRSPRSPGHDWSELGPWRVFRTRRLGFDSLASSGAPTERASFKLRARLRAWAGEQAPDRLALSWETVKLVLAAHASSAGWDFVRPFGDRVRLGMELGLG